MGLPTPRLTLKIWSGRRPDMESGKLHLTRAQGNALELDVVIGGFSGLRGEVPECVNEEEVAALTPEVNREDYRDEIRRRGEC